MTRFQDGCFLVDNSLIEKITTCPTKADFAYGQNRVPAGNQAALRFGLHIHSALALRNAKLFANVENDEEEQIALLTKDFTDTPLEDEGWRNLDSAVKVIKGYNACKIFNKSDEHILAHPKTGGPLIEQSLAIDTKRVISGHRIIYIGRIDRIMKLPDGIFVRDYKTTTMLGDMTWSEAQMSEQLKGYCWAYRETFGEEPLGYCYDVLAINESIQNAIFDEILGKIIPAPLKNGKESKAMPLRFESQRFFTREPAGQLDEWFENMLQQVETFLWHHSRGIYPHHHRHCRHQYGLCEYFGVCSLPERSRASALASNAFKPDEWSPLHHK